MQHNAAIFISAFRAEIIRTDCNGITLSLNNKAMPKWLHIIHLHPYLCGWLSNDGDKFNEQARKDTNTPIDACKHTYTHRHIQTHTLTHACTHARMHARMHTRKHAWTHAQTHIHAHTHMHTCTHAHTHACTDTHTRMHARTHARTHTEQTQTLTILRRRWKYFAHPLRILLRGNREAWYWKPLKKVMTLQKETSFSAWEANTEEKCRNIR